MKLATYEYRNFRFEGISEGGVQTCMTVPQLKLSFDIGRGASELVDIPTILLTHGHLDHSSGIPYHISQRNLRHLAPATIYTPPEVAPPLRKIMELWCEIEGYQAQYSIEPVEYDRIYPLAGNMHFQALRSVHRVPSNGYAIVEKSRRLKEEFKHLAGPEIARIKKERDDLFYDTVVPHIVFSGDTQIEFVLEHELVRRAKVLFLECTYVDDERPVERARKWGHTHLYEIAAHAEAFRDVERLFLIHFSPRYSPRVITQQIKAKLPDWLAEKTVPFIL